MTDYISGTLAELNNHYAKKQPKLLEYITEKTPILEQIKFVPSSHGLWNAYEEVTGIHGAGFVDMNAPLPSMGVDTKLKKVDLAIMGGEMFCPEDKAQMFGGADAYFAKHTPSLLKDAGMKTEEKIIYDNIRQFAIDNENVVSAGGSASTGTSGLYSMVCFRQTEGENCGLYSPQGFQNGAGLDVKKINGGNLYHKSDILGYGLRFKGYFGMQLADKDGVAAIVNIKSGHLPTEAQIDDMLIAAKATPADSFIMCHPKVLSLINKYKGDILRLVPSDKNLDRTFYAWNGIRIITSYNFKNGTEAAVSLS